MVNAQQKYTKINKKTNEEEIIVDNDSSRVLKKAENSAIEVAKLLLAYDPERKYFKDGKMTSRAEETNPPTIGNFRLNKMLHICQMLHYAKYRKPLFFEYLRAYPRGAIVYIVYKNFFDLFREELEPQEILIKEESKKFINKVYCYFKKNSDQELENFSHDDIAWKETWERKAEEDDDRMMVKEKEKNFYRDLLGHIVEEVGLNQ